MAKTYGVDNISLWIDHDRTKIEWFGRKRQASKMPFRHENVILNPENYKENKPLLLDLADILAYSTAHSYSSEARSDKDFFRSICMHFRAEHFNFQFHEQVFK